MSFLNLLLPKLSSLFVYGLNFILCRGGQTHLNSVLDQIQWVARLTQNKDVLQVVPLIYATIGITVL